MKKVIFPINIIFLIIFLVATTNVIAQRSHNSKSQSSKFITTIIYHSGNSSLSDPAGFSNNELYPDRKRKTDIYSEKNKFENKNRKETENYFHIDKSGRTLWDGKHWVVSDFPLRIYVRESSSSYYKTLYKKYITYAFNVWRKADDRINFNFVNNKKDADIIINFVENLGKKYEENYLGLTEYDVNSQNEIKLSTIQISLLKFGTEKIPDGEIKATLIHEIGHAIGLGHSDNELDIMYPYIGTNHDSEMNYDELSKGDKYAVKDVVDLAEENQFVWK